MLGAWLSSGAGKMLVIWLSSHAGKMLGVWLRAGAGLSDSCVGWTWSLSGVGGCGFIVVFTEAAFDGYLDQLLIRQVAVDRVVLKAQRWTTGGSWRREASCLHDSADEERITTK